MLFTTNYLKENYKLKPTLNPNVVTEEFIEDIYQRIEINPGIVYSDFVQDVIKDYKAKEIEINPSQIHNAISCLRFTGKIFEMN